MATEKKAAAWRAEPDEHCSMESDEPSTGKAQARSRRTTRLTMRRAASAANLRELRQQAFQQKHGAVQALAIQAQVKQVQLQLAEQRRAQRWVMHPEKNTFLRAWDTITLLALVYTATLTPFETAFEPGDVSNPICLLYTSPSPRDS